MRLFSLTARSIVITARLLLLPCIGVLAGGIVTRDVAPGSAAAMTFVTGLVLLTAAPGLRAAELIGALALTSTMLEWLHGAFSGTVETERWQAGLAVAAAMAALLKVQHLRSLARHDAYVPLRQLERRSAVMGRPIRPRHAPRAERG